uniref:F-box domain-containing protein n=1 Tax=Eutreptiella gymnastica TaxID=73025 RepID=A0A7S4FEE5_9EUGL
MDLPEDTLRYVFGFLTKPTMYATLCLVCKHWARALPRVQFAPLLMCIKKTKALFVDARGFVVDEVVVHPGVSPRLGHSTIAVAPDGCHLYACEGVTLTRYRVTSGFLRKNKVVLCDHRLNRTVRVIYGRHMELWLLLNHGSCPELLNVDLRKSKIMNRFALAANPEQNHCIRAYDGCYVPREDCLVVLVQSTTTYIVKVPLLKDRFQQAAATYSWTPLHFALPGPPGLVWEGRLRAGTLTLLGTEELCYAVPAAGVVHASRLKDTLGIMEPWDCPGLLGLCALHGQMYGLTAEGLKIVRNRGGKRTLGTRMDCAGGTHLLAVG